MDEYSRIIIEEYCMKYPKTKRSTFVKAYDVCCIPTDMQIDAVVTIDFQREKC
ncbi:MAG: hypothetical protein ACLR7D_17150 [Lachnospira eligens]